MSTDRELLEAAAKAAGVEHQGIFYPDKGLRLGERGDGYSTWIAWWDPRNDDGDALRLAVAAGVTIDMVDHSAYHRDLRGNLVQEYWGGDHPPCYRAAIVRAAAEIERRHRSRISMTTTNAVPARESTGQLSIFAGVCWRCWPGMRCKCAPDSTVADALRSELFLFDQELQRENRRAREFSDALQSLADAVWKARQARVAVGGLDNWPPDLHIIAEQAKSAAAILGESRNKDRVSDLYRKISTAATIPTEGS